MTTALQSRSTECDALQAVLQLLGAPAPHCRSHRSRLSARATGLEHAWSTSGRPQEFLAKRQGVDLGTYLAQVFKVHVDEKIPAAKKR